MRSLFFKFKMTRKTVLRLLLLFILFSSSISVITCQSRVFNLEKATDNSSEPPQSRPDDQSIEPTTLFLGARFRDEKYAIAQTERKVRILDMPKQKCTFFKFMDKHTFNWDFKDNQFVPSSLRVRLDSTLLPLKDFSTKILWDRKTFSFNSVDLFMRSMEGIPDGSYSTHFEKSMCEIKVLSTTNQNDEEITDPAAEYEFFKMKATMECHLESTFVIGADKGYLSFKSDLACTGKKGATPFNQDE